MTAWTVITPRRFGYDVELRIEYEGGLPSLAFGPSCASWALTRSGAERKSRRWLGRQQRRDDRNMYVDAWTVTL